MSYRSMPGGSHGGGDRGAPVGDEGAAVGANMAANSAAAQASGNANGANGSGGGGGLPLNWLLKAGQLGLGVMGMFGAGGEYETDPNAFFLPGGYDDRDRADAARTSNEKEATQAALMQAQARQQQGQLATSLFSQMNGGGPNLAAAQERAATDRNIAQAYAMAQSGGGNNPMMARAAANNVAMANQQAASDSAQQRMQQQLLAQQQLGGVLQGQRGQDIGMFGAGNQAALGNMGQMIDISKAEQQGQIAQQQLKEQAYADKMKRQTGAMGGLLGGIGGMLGSGMADGGEVPGYSYGGPISGAGPTYGGGMQHAYGLMTQPQANPGVAYSPPPMALPPQASPMQHGYGGGMPGSTGQGLPVRPPTPSPMTMPSQAMPPQSGMGGSMYRQPTMFASGGPVGPAGLAYFGLPSRGMNQGYDMSSDGKAAGAGIGGLLKGLGSSSTDSGVTDAVPAADDVNWSANGGYIPGYAIGGNRSSNDTVPAMLSPGEIVLPRSVTQDDDAAEKAKSFVEAIQAKRRARRVA